MSELELAIADFEKNAEAKAAIITGAGPKSFVAGADISEFVGLSSSEGMALAQTGQNVFFRIQ